MMRHRQYRVVHRCAAVSTMALLMTAGLVRVYKPVSIRAEQPAAAADAPSLYLSDGFGAGLWQEEPTDPPVQETLPAPTEAPARTDPGPKPYPEQWTLTGSIEKMQYGYFSGTQYFDLEGAGQVVNKTELPNETLLAESRERPAFPIVKDGTPQVLIMHTHTTECYEPFERDAFAKDFNYRTTDPEKSVCAVGEQIARQLEAAGIGVVHDTTIHDYPSYNGSYARSAETVKACLAQYPSIRVVLDIHRDAIGDENVIKQPTVTVDGQKAAQVMIISGCDDGTMGMPDYLQNFRLACLLQRTMETDYPGLTRPVLFDYRKYNQDLTTGSLLIEVGSHGNTLDQAVYAGELIGNALAEALGTLT